MAQLAYATLALFVVTVLPLVYVLRNISKTRLGLMHEWVLVVLSDGRVFKSRRRDCLTVRDTLVYVDGYKLNLGPPNQRFCDKAAMERLLAPRFKQAGVLQGADLYRWRWQHDRVSLAVEAAIAVVVVLALVAILGVEGEPVGDWLEVNYEQCQARQVRGAVSGTDAGALAPKG
ncbi:hypothetical protein A3709_17165 [Halioglobus sp. HI00S01]|uniref:hypothetical protein n=1 Tax=Halioglobus sp. HI00S01 TaxID=1822214 RepID=UPI0007C3530F|nr:hypothetical protein [Halioglobus sp. HI00S01]KZX58733.1 hypothetical protein A3709_17165 [Halioglobus sp. HI00S01]